MSMSNGSKRGPYRSGIRRREQIVNAAIGVFGEYGFAGGSLRTIAEKVDVSHTTLIQYFGSKEGLLMAVLAEWDRRTVEARLTGVSGLGYFRRLPDVMDAHLRQRGLLELFVTIAAEASSPTHPAHDFIKHRYSSNLSTLTFHLQEAIDNGDISTLSPIDIDIEVRLITAVMDGVGLQWLLDPSTDVYSCVDAYVTRAIRSWKGEI